MRIESTQKQTPESSASGSSADREAEDQERFVWERLAPRLLHPSKLAFIRALLEQGRPLTVCELAESAGIAEEHARHQCKSMQRAGVLEAVSIASRADSEDDEPSYFFARSVEPTHS